MRTQNIPILVAVLIVCSTLALAQKPEDSAQQSADSWMTLVDSGKYADSWQNAASIFKTHVTKDQWESMISAT